MKYKIGFPCKWIDSFEQVNGIKPLDACAKYNAKTTTVASFNRLSKTEAEAKMWVLIKHNIEAARLLVEKVGNLNEHLRMVRLGSDILPLYTLPSCRWFYSQPDVCAYIERGFAEIGRSARFTGTRLSFHPGQFTVLASIDSNIVERSIVDFEYHADMVRWMGFGQQFQDFKINVHIAGRAGPDGIRAAYPRLSPEARNCITIENEEYAHGLDTCLELADLLPVVLDIHHHWINTGQYIHKRDERVARVIESWRGVRPTMHYSVSREEHLPQNWPIENVPVLKTLLESGYKKGKLRAHSDSYWNSHCNRWALSFLDDFDIMAESKGKNLSSFKLHEEFLNAQKQR